MNIQPHTILVETHGMHGAPKSEVEHRLDAINYEITNRGVAEARKREFCIDNEVYVLCGKFRGN
jgi:hypothetical protein